MKIPLWFIVLVNIYSVPIYVPETVNKETEQQIRLHLQEKLLSLERATEEMYKKV